MSRLHIQYNISVTAYVTYLLQISQLAPDILFLVV